MKKPSLLIPALIFIIIWVIFFVQLFTGFDIKPLALNPQNTETLFTLITSPFIHHNLGHIAGNSIPLLIYMVCLFFFYRHVSYIVTVCLVIIPSIFVWFIASPYSYHIGISGMVFGLASFLVVAGFRSRDLTRFLISLFVLYTFKEAFIYLFPVTNGISWQSHVGGFFTGIILASILPQKHE